MIALAVLQGTGIIALADNGGLCGLHAGHPDDQSVFTLLVTVLVMTAGTAWSCGSASWSPSGHRQRHVPDDLL